MIAVRTQSIPTRLLREVRLLWLLGHAVREIACRIGRDRSTVYRYIRKHDLAREEAPLERESLLLAVLHDRSADRLLDPGLPPDEAAALTGLVIRLDGERRRLEAARQKLTPAADPLEQSEDDDDEDPDTLAARLEALAVRLENKGTGSDPEPAVGRAGSGRADPDFGKPLAAGSPRYTASAAGPLADLSVHGRTWRWQDPGWG